MFSGKFFSGLSILKMSKNYFTSRNSKNLIQLFDRDPFPLWQYHLGELQEHIFNKTSEIIKHALTNNYWTGSDYDTPAEPLTLSGPAFSVVRQARGGAQRPRCQNSRLTSTN